MIYTCKVLFLSRLVGQGSGATPLEGRAVTGGGPLLLGRFCSCNWDVDLFEQPPSPYLWGPQEIGSHERFHVTLRGVERVSHTDIFLTNFSTKVTLQVKQQVEACRQDNNYLLLLNYLKVTRSTLAVRCRSLFNRQFDYVYKSEVKFLPLYTETIHSNTIRHLSYVINFNNILLGYNSVIWFIY